MVHARVLEEKEKRPKYDRKRSKFRQSLASRISDPLPKSEMKASPFVCTIPFETSGGFRSDILDNSGPAGEAGSSLSSYTGVQVVSSASCNSVGADARPSAAKDGGNNAEEWYGEEVSMDDG